MNKFTIIFASFSFLNLAYAINFETTKPVKTFNVEIVKSDNLSHLAGYDKNGNTRIFLNRSAAFSGRISYYFYGIVSSDRDLLYTSKPYELSENEYEKAAAYINSTNDGCKVILNLNAKTYKLESLKQDCNKP